MSSLNLAGYDVVVHLAESVINQGLQAIPSGTTFPVRERNEVTLTALAVPLGGVGNPTKDVPLLYDAFLELERPEVELDQNSGRVTVRCDLSPASQLTFLAAALPADASLLTGVRSQIPLGGSIELNCPFATDEVDAVWAGQPVSGRAAVARAAGIPPTIVLSIPSADSGSNVPLATSVIGASPVQVATGAIESILTNVIAGGIGDQIGDLPLTNPVRLNVGATPVQTVTALAAQISPVPSPPGISFGVLSGIEHAGSGGTVPAPPGVLGSTGAVIWAANYWTLHLVCTALTAAHPGMTFTYSESTPSASFNGAVVIEGGDEPLTVRRLDITVNPGGGLALDGYATASGSCWDADIDFDFTLDLTCDPETGAVLPVASEPNVDVDVDKDIWCQIIGIIVGAVVGFITGAIIGAIVSGGSPWGALIGGGIGAVLGGIGGYVVVGEFIDPLGLDGVSLDTLSVLGGLTLPLPVGGAGIIAQNCNFDDLGVVGDLVYVDLAERHRSGSIQLSAGRGFDLDSGTTRSMIGPGDDIADMLWTGAALQTVQGAVFGPVFGPGANAFSTLSLTDLEGFSYGGGNLSASQFPVNFSIDLPFVGGSPPRSASFAMRTDQGRYAKCRAWRDLAGRLNIEYIVYARPSICISSVVTLHTLSQRVVESGTEDCTEVLEVPIWQTTPVGPPVTVGPFDADFRGVVEEMQTKAEEPGTGGRGLRGRLSPFDDLTIGPVLPPVRPTRGCGTHTTIEHHPAAWKLVDRRQRAIVQALPTGAVAPLKYRWVVFGTELPPGNGTISVGPIRVTYDEDSPVLTLLAGRGEDLAGSITVLAIDADGRNLRDSRQINSPSRKRLGGCCAPAPNKLTLGDAVRRLDELAVAQRVYTAGMTRLSRIAASGRVPDGEGTSIVEAVGPRAGKRSSRNRE